MFEIVMALVVLGLLVTVFSALVFWKRRKAGVEQEINYYAFFILGICLALYLGAAGEKRRCGHQSEYRIVSIDDIANGDVVWMA